MNETDEPLQVTALSAWPFVIDRRLNVPLGVQLRGQMEYGIAGGELPRGSRLPSVRELSHDLGLAHMTVAQVYKELLAPEPDRDPAGARHVCGRRAAAGQRARTGSAAATAGRLAFPR